MQRLIVILFLACAGLTSYAQIDREFWFVAPNLSNEHDNSLANGNGQLCLTSYDKVTTVRISQPAITETTNRYYFAPIVQSLQPHQSVDIPFGATGPYRSNADGISGVGLHIESDEDLSVYFAQVNQNSEIYTLKGRNALGMDFVVPMQRSYPNTAGGYCAIEVVASEPNTQVQVTTPFPTRQNTTGDPFTMTLNAGEVLAIRAMDQDASRHLGGTIIHSDKPIAVNTTDDSVDKGGNYDLIGEQIVPNDLAGSSYIAVRHTTTGGSEENVVLYAFPSMPIQYSVNGGANQTLQGGESVVINLTTYTTPVVYISADKDFIAFQTVSADGGEMGGTVLPRLDCTGSREVVVKKRFNNQQIDLLVPTKAAGDFTINGAAPNIVFMPVPQNPQWSYCSFSGTNIFDANGVVRVHNSSSIFHLAIIDYGGGTCTYGYFSGYNQLAMNPYSPKDVYYKGETIVLGITDADLFDNVVWTFPDGSTHPNADVQNLVTKITDGGYYYVSGESKDGCPLSQDRYGLLLHAVIPEKRETLVCQTEQHPTDWYELYDTTHLGVNMLTNTEPITATCANGKWSTVWTAKPQLFVTKGRTYRFTMSYLSSTGAKPNVQVLLDDTVISVNKVLVKNTAKTLSLDWTASHDGNIILCVNGGNATNSPKLTLSNLSFCPVLPVQDTLYYRVYNCSEPPPTPPEPPIPPCPDIQTIRHDTTVCDTLLPMMWRGHYFTVPDSTFDTIRSPRGCDSIAVICRLDTVHCVRPEPPVPPIPPEPPVPTYPLDVQLLTPSVSICDGEEQAEISYRVVRGTPHLLQVTFNGRTWTEQVDSTSSVLRLSTAGLTPNPYEVTLQFTDTVHDVTTSVMNSHVLMLYDPMKVFAQKWNNVLAIYSPAYSGYSQYTWDSYQWYKNGQPMSGEDFSRYRIADGIFCETDYYQVLLRRQQDGVELLTCPYYPIIKNL